MVVANFSLFTLHFSLIYCTFAAKLQTIMKILITGASGFIGSFIVEEALKRGFETWAAVRKSSSKAYLQDERINFIELNLSSKEQLVGQLKDKEFDYVVHAAGVTKCLNKQDFSRINTQGTKNLVDALVGKELFRAALAHRCPCLIALAQRFLDNKRADKTAGACH